MPIDIVLEYFPAFDASYDDMVQRTRSVYAGLTWHVLRLSHRLENGKLYFYGRPHSPQRALQRTHGPRAPLKEMIGSDIQCILVMITGLYKIDSFVPDDVNQSVFLGNSTGPNTRTKKF